MNTTRTLVLIASLALVACGQKPSEPVVADPAPMAAPATPPPHEIHPPPAADVAPLPAIPAGAKVFFVEPADGARVQGPLENGKVAVHVKMGAEGIVIKPAGAVEAGSGHHHILVDVDPIPGTSIVPKDERHLHFGQGQTEATLALAPGEHTLRLQLADGMHRSYGPDLAASIKITVAATGTVGAALEAMPKTAPPKKSL
jgi:hypothetical protein